MHAWEIQKNCIDDLIQKQIWRYRLRKQMHGYQQEKGNGMRLGCWAFTARAWVQPLVRELKYHKVSSADNKSKPKDN